MRTSSLFSIVPLYQNLLVHGFGGDAEGGEADVVVHLDGVQTLRVRTLRAVLAGLIKTPLRAGLVEPRAVRVQRVAGERQHALIGY